MVMRFWRMFSHFGQFGKVEPRHQNSVIEVYIFFVFEELAVILAADKDTVLDPGQPRDVEQLLLDEGEALFGVTVLEFGFEYFEGEKRPFGFVAQLIDRSTPAGCIDEHFLRPEGVCGEGV